MKKDNRCVREQITARLIYNLLEDGTLDSYLDNDLYRKASMSRSKRKSNIKRYKNDK